jgi:divalent metal cation (Fe/Co/Zn/Cd) transporter
MPSPLILCMFFGSRSSTSTAPVPSRLASLSCAQLLYFWCAALQKRSDSMAALAEDHLNDVMSNAGAIVTAGVASLWSHGW